MRCCLHLLMFLQCSHNLDWLGFCQAVLPTERNEVTVVDYLWYTWKLLIDFCNDDGLSCIFTGQWKDLAEPRKFTSGQVIKLGVTGEANNRVIYLCAPPMLVLKTTVQPWPAVVEAGVAYRLLELFWKKWLVLLMTFLQLHVLCFGVVVVVLYYYDMNIILRRWFMCILF